MLILPQLPKDFNPNNVGITKIVKSTNKEDTLLEIPDEIGCRKRFHECIYGDCSCKECGEEGLYFDHCNYVYCPHCKKKYSMKADTPVFNHSNLTFKQIFILVFCWQKQFGIGETRYSTGLSYPSIRKWFTRLRMALAPSECILDGEVEIDGSYIGKRKARQHLVAGLLEVGTNRLVLTRRLSKDRETVEATIQQYVKSGTYIYTDELGSYNELHLLGYHHDTTNHSKWEFGITNRIEAVWSSLKRALNHIYRCLSFSEYELDLILREYELRYNSPVLFYNVNNYLKLCGCSKLFR